MAAVDSAPFEHHLSIDEIEIAEQQRGLSIHDDDKDPTIIINEPQEDSSNEQELSKSSSQAHHLRGPRSINNSNGDGVHADEHVGLKVESGVLSAEDHARKQDGIINESGMSMGSDNNVEFDHPVDTIEKFVSESCVFSF